MPVLSYHFGLSPSEVWNLTIEEWASYQRGLEQIERESK
jgi:hypothetical protein